MNTLRDAAQQALEALENPARLVPYNGEWRSMQSIAVTALRAALEQDEPEGLVCARCGALAFDPVVPQQAEPVQEPVGWRIRAVGSMGWRGPWRAYWQSARPGVNEPEFCEFEPLYTAPPQRKPLTDDRLWELWNIDSDDAYKNCPTYFQGFRYVARIVEWAHGIEEEK